MLLDTDVDIDHVNRIGYTALHEAVILGDGGPSHQRTVAALVGPASTNHRGPEGGHGSRRGPGPRLHRIVDLLS